MLTLTVRSSRPGGVLAQLSRSKRAFFVFVRINVRARFRSLVVVVGCVATFSRGCSPAHRGRASSVMRRRAPKITPLNIQNSSCEKKISFV